MSLRGKKQFVNNIKLQNFRCNKINYFHKTKTLQIVLIVLNKAYFANHFFLIEHDFNDLKHGLSNNLLCSTTNKYFGKIQQVPYDYFTNTSKHK